MAHPRDITKSKEEAKLNLQYTGIHVKFKVLHDFMSKVEFEA